MGMTSKLNQAKSVLFNSRGRRPPFSRQKLVRGLFQVYRATGCSSAVPVPARNTQDRLLSFKMSLSTQGDQHDDQHVLVARMDNVKILASLLKGINFREVGDNRGT